MPQIQLPGNVTERPVASEAQAWAGNDNTLAMSSLRVVQSIDARRPQFASRSEAEGANVPAPVKQIGVLSGGRVLNYVRDAAGTALATGDGATWSPADAEVTPEHWGAVGDGVTNDTAPLQDAFTWGGKILLRKLYAFGSNLLPADNSVIEGCGFATGLKAIGNSNISAFLSTFASGRVGGFTVRNMLLDGNRAARSATSGSGVGCLGTSNATVDTVWARDWPRSGVFLDGNSADCDNVTVRNCRITGNALVGLSQHTVKNAKITGNYFRDSGLENLTIDGESRGCIVTGNTFKRALGGCGNIGWDGGDDSVFTGNTVDNENDTTQSAGNRNGVCINANDKLTEQFVVSNNVIINYPEYGVYARDRTSTGKVKSGRGVVTGNTFKKGTAATYDVRVEDTDQQIDLRGNQWDGGWITTETAAEQLVVSPGDVRWAATLSGNKTMTVSTSYQDIAFDTADYVKGCSLAATGHVTINAPGLYAITVKVNLSGLTATASTRMALLLLLPDAPDEAINFPVTSNLLEHQVTVFRQLSKGELYARIRSIDGSGTYSIVASQQTFFEGALIG